MKAKRSAPQLLTPEMRTADAELKKNVPAMLAGAAFKIRQIIGEPSWGPLDRTSRHQLGKYVRANLAEYGLVYVGKAGTIALYKKSTV